MSSPSKEVELHNLPLAVANDPPLTTLPPLMWCTPGVLRDFVRVGRVVVAVPATVLPRHRRLPSADRSDFCSTTVGERGAQQPR